MSTVRRGETKENTAPDGSELLTPRNRLGAGRQSSPSSRTLKTSNSAHQIRSRVPKTPPNKEDILDKSFEDGSLDVAFPDSKELCRETKNAGTGRCNCSNKNQKDRENNQRFWNKLQQERLENERQLKEVVRREKLVQSREAEVAGLAERENIVVQREDELALVNQRLANVEVREERLFQEKESIRRQQEQWAAQAESLEAAERDFRDKEILLNLREKRLEEERRELHQQSERARRDIQEAEERYRDATLVRHAALEKEHVVMQREHDAAQIEKELVKRETEIKLDLERLETLKDANEKLKAEAQKEKLKAIDEKSQVNKALKDLDDERTAHQAEMRFIEEKKALLSKDEAEASRLKAEKKDLEQEADRLQRLEKNIKAQNEQERISLAQREEDCERLRQEVKAKEEEINMKETKLRSLDEAMLQREQRMKSLEVDMDDRKQQLGVWEAEIRTQQEAMADCKTASGAEVEQLRRELASYQEREDHVELKRTSLDFEDATLKKKRIEMEDHFEKEKAALRLRQEQLSQKERAFRNQAAQVKAPRCSLPGKLTGIKRHESQDGSPSTTPKKASDESSTKLMKRHSVAGPADASRARSSLVLFGDSTMLHEPSLEDTASSALSESAMPEMSPPRMETDEGEENNEGEDVPSETSLLVIDDTEDNAI